MFPDCDSWRVANACHNRPKLTKLLHVSSSVLQLMVTNNCITAEQMRSVLNEPTPEYQNYALCGALEQQGLMMSFEQIVKCFDHSCENTALLWVLRHKGGKCLLILYIKKLQAIHLMLYKR